MGKNNFTKGIVRGNSHQPFRRRERAMIKFRNAKSLQKFISIHASVHNPFNLERHLIARYDFAR